MNHLDPEILQHFQEDKIYQEKHSEEMNDVSLQIKIMHEKIDMLINRSSPALEWFEGLTFTKKLILTILGIISAIGGTILLFRELFKHR